jgi:hypothetical protein
MNTNDVYGLEPHEKVHCYFCLKQHNQALYGPGEAYLCGAGHSPLDGNANYVCTGHLDEDAVKHEVISSATALQILEDKLKKN